MYVERMWERGNSSPRKKGEMQYRLADFGGEGGGPGATDTRRTGNHSTGYSTRGMSIPRSKSATEAALDPARTGIYLWDPSLARLFSFSFSFFASFFA